MAPSVSLQQLKAIMPHAHDRALLYLHYLNSAMGAGGIDTPRQKAAFLATVGVESEELFRTSDTTSGWEYNERVDLGNTRPEAIAAAAAYDDVPGVFYRGRGLIRLVGFNIYKQCGEALGLDLVQYPVMLAQPEHACTSAVWFWQVNKVSEAPDFDSCCELVARGKKTVKAGSANGYKERVMAYNRALRAFGVI